MSLPVEGTGLNQLQSYKSIKRKGKDIISKEKQKRGKEIWGEIKNDVKMAKEVLYREKKMKISMTSSLRGQENENNTV